MHPTRNLRVVETDVLPAPETVTQEIPVTHRAAQTVISGRREVQAILDGQDHRKLVIVGPCSIHDPESAMEYGQRLIKLRERVSDEIAVIMRVYFEKPRTTIGWKGLINDPHLDGSNDIPQGIRTARSLLADLNAAGLPAATELLDPIIPQYIADLVSWAAIGARTTESQTHREMASGLSMPVGFKNGTDGSLTVAIHAMMAAAQPHSFLGIDEAGRVGVVRTRGNPYGHLVLRGGHEGPNYGRDQVAAAAQAATESGVRSSIVVDCSHGNSSKDYRRQPLVLVELGRQVAEEASPVIGAMIESHLNEGKQKLGRSEDLSYGQSVTDGCVDFETTEKMLLDFARAVSRRPRYSFNSGQAAESA